MRSRTIRRGLTVAAVLVLPLAAWAFASYHVGGEATVATEQAAYSIKDNVTLDPVWPVGDYYARACSVCNVGSTNECEIRWAPRDGVSTAWKKVYVQPLVPFCRDSEGDDLGAVRDIEVNTQTSRGNDECDLVIDCRVERR